MIQVLVVHSYPITRELIAEMIGERFEVRTAKSIEESMMYTADPRLGLIILDEDTLNGDAGMFTRGIKALRPRLPIVVTVNGLDQDLQADMRIHFMEFTANLDKILALTKPAA